MHWLKSGRLWSQAARAAITGNDKDDDSPSNPITMLFANGSDKVTLENVLCLQESIGAIKWGNQKLERL